MDELNKTWLLPQQNLVPGILLEIHLPIFGNNVTPVHGVIVATSEITNILNI
jgi:hypothetical protein